MTKTLTRAVGIAFAVSCAFMAAPDAEAQNYPTKQITVVAASGPGGATDILARFVARQMEKDFGQTVVVVNRPGGGGAVALAQLKNDPPDGYMFGVSPSSAWTKAWQEIDKPTYNVDDFSYVVSMVGGGCAWVVKADSPYKTWKDLVAAAKAGKSLSFGAFSNDNKLTLRYVARQDGVDFKMISYRSVPEVLQAVLGGHIDFGFSGGSHASHVKKGTMRVLAAVDEKRVGDSPDVATLKEMGYGIADCAVFMMAGPKGLSKDIAEKIAQSAGRAMQTEEAQKFLESRETEALVLGPDALTARVKADAREFANTLKVLK